MQESHFRLLAVLLAWLTFATLPACKGAQGEPGATAAHTEEEGLPADSVTRWTDKSELFMEYEPPVVGREGKFAAHMTSIATFKAVTEGTMKLIVKMADGTTLASTADKPSSPGIFRALIRPTKAGKWSLKNRLFVVVAAVALSIYGAFTAANMPVDVFPDLTAPTVTILTEAHGLAPQEVEALVTFPLESSMNGATGVRRVRSASGIGISVVWVEFDWGTDIYVARQIVNEKMQLVASQIPPDIGPPTLAPISSIMGEILFLSLKSDRHSPLELRETGDWVIRKRLLSIPGVAQVVPIGGGVKQFQVLIAPEKLQAFGVSLQEVVKALEGSNENSSGGFLVQGAQERLIRGMGRINSGADVERTVVAVRDGVPVLVGQVSHVAVGPAIKRGEGSSNAEPAVVLGVLKQPGANTLDLTREIDHHLDEIQKTLPEGMKIDRQLFRQSDFIKTAIAKVSVALRDGRALPLPLALIGGVIAVLLGGGVLSVASLVGFITLFGIATRNGIMMVSHYEHLQDVEGAPLDEAVVRGSLERLSPILMTALCAGLALIPLVLAGDQPGNEIQAPMGVVILGGLLSATALNMLVVPVLYSMFAGRRRNASSEAPPATA